MVARFHPFPPVFGWAALLGVAGRLDVAGLLGGAAANDPPCRPPPGPAGGELVESAAAKAARKSLLEVEFLDAVTQGVTADAETLRRAGLIAAALVECFDEHRLFYIFKGSVLVLGRCHGGPGR